MRSQTEYVAGKLAVARCLGNITVCQALFRPLEKTESRQQIASRTKFLLGRTDMMNVDPALLEALHDMADAA